jgi:hypothetical protein
MTDMASLTEYAAAAAVYARLLDTRTWLREAERGARRRNPFGCFRVIRFRQALRD